MDYSPEGSSVYGISQAKVLEWISVTSRGDVPSPWQGHGTREEPVRQLFPRGCPGGPVCPLPLSILLLLGFLLIIGNFTYSDQALLEKSKPI